MKHAPPLPMGEGPGVRSGFGEAFLFFMKHAPLSPWERGRGGGRLGENDVFEVAKKAFWHDNAMRSRRFCIRKTDVWSVFFR